MCLSPISRTGLGRHRGPRHVTVLAGITLAAGVAALVVSSSSGARAQLAAKMGLMGTVPPPAFATVPNDRPGQKAAAFIVPATIQAFFVTDLYAKDTGYVSQVAADMGDHVKKGQVLASIDDPELEAQYDRARAAVEQAEASIDVAKRQLTAMQADLALHEATLDRQKTLFAGKATTAQSLDEAQAKERVARANLATGQAKILLAEANLAAAEAETERLKALLRYDRVTAPFDGVITRRLVNPGDLVQAPTSSHSRPLFTCQAIQQVRVLADVPEANARSVRPGLAAAVKLYGEDELTVHGEVNRVASALDPATRTMRVEIDLPNPDEKLLPGMYAQVTFELEPRHIDRPKR